MQGLLIEKNDERQRNAEAPLPHKLSGTWIEKARFENCIALAFVCCMSVAVCQVKAQNSIKPGQVTSVEGQRPDAKSCADFTEYGSHFNVNL